MIAQSDRRSGGACHRIVISRLLKKMVPGGHTPGTGGRMPRDHKDVKDAMSNQTRASGTDRGPLRAGTVAAALFAVCLAQIGLAMPATLNGTFQEVFNPT